MPLMEAGLDSIGAVELRNAVNERYGVELPATITFDYPTIGDLAHYLAQRTAPSAMQAAMGGFDQMQAYVPDSFAAAEIAEVHSSAVMKPCSHHCPASLILPAAPFQCRRWPVGVLLIWGII